MTTTLSRAQARRIALAAQGFLDSAHDPATLRTFSRTLERTGVLQVDSVNVLARAHLMPLYSRMGPYDVGLLRRAAQQRPRRVVEYWAHVQAFMPVELWPLMEFRRRAFREDRSSPWGMQADDDLAQALLVEITARGACTARDLDDGAPRTKEHWGWNWSQARKALDRLYLTGEVAVVGRTSSFEVRYDLPERVLPRAVLETAVPEDREAHRALVRRAAISHGVATERCLRDYYRMRTDQVRPAVADLVEDGELVPVGVEGWERPAYLHRDARRPRRVRARTLLSPFDPVVWERERTERLFGFRYRIEIYVPAHLRRHGYYVLPFLLDEALVARVDLKAERGTGVLLVRSAHAEADAPEETAHELADELWRLAGWLDLDDVCVEPRGDLAVALEAAVGDGPSRA